LSRLPRILALAVLALPALGQGQAASRKPSVEAAEQVARILRRIDDPRPPQAQDLVRSLASLGPAATEELLAIHVGATPPPQPPEDSAPPPLDPFAPNERPLVEDVVLAALKALPPGEVVSAIRIRAMGEVPLPVRANGLRALGEVGGGRALAALFDSLAELSDFHRSSPGLREPAVAALASILAGDDHCWIDLERRLPKLDRGLEPILVRGIARAGSPRGFPVLVGLLGRPGADESLLFEAIEDLSERAAPWIQERECAEIRCALDAEDPEIQRRAAIVLGRAQDFESAPALIALLASEDGRLQRGALWALETMSGLSLAPEVPRWRAWYEEQSAWFEEAVPELRAKIGSGDPAEAVAAIAEICQRPLFRHRLSEELGRALASARIEIALAACAALSQLRSPLAVPALVEALRRPEESVRAAASTALHAITGLELPADFNVWTQVVEP